MQRTPIVLDPAEIPASLRPFLQDARVFDSSCSPAARVYFLDKGPGFYLKTAPNGTLRREAELTAFFNKKGLSAEVVAYESLEKDWMLTRRMVGEDCIHRMYLDDPVRLCDTTALLLRQLHETDLTGCPVPDRTAEYLAAARRNYEKKAYDSSLFPDNWGYATPEEAWAELERNSKYLKNDTLLHGDYCLPNILLDNWRFSGFIDLGNGGVGDRHVDLFWGAWTLNFNLKTDAYRDRFFDAYGRDRIDLDLIDLVGVAECFG